MATPLQIFTDYMQQDFERIEGWLTRHAAAVFDALLAAQREHGQNGDILEIGAFKGKSAALLGRHAGEGEQFFVVDSDVWPSFEEMRANVQRASKTPIFLNMPSSMLGPMVAKGELFRTCRFVHIDGDHSYEETYNDLKNAAQMINDSGVVVVDDFFNFQHVHVSEAVFAYIRENPRSLVMFLAGYNKAFLCRPKAFQAYHDFVRLRLGEALDARGVGDYEICQTTHYPADSMCYGISEREGLSVGYRVPDWKNAWRTEPARRDGFSAPRKEDLD